MKNNQPKPPEIAKRLLSRLVRKQQYHAIIGDFEEVYQEVFRSNGRFIAHIWYWIHLIKSFPGFLTDTFVWGGVLVKNYFKISLRNIMKHKVYSLINLLGLSVGLASFLLILIYVRYEYSYDRYHKKINSIYRVVCEDRGREYMNSFEWAQSHRPIAAMAKKECPEVMAAGGLNELRNVRLSCGENHFIEDHFIVADLELLNIFSFPFVKGDPETALDAPFSIVLTEKMAEKYFGDSNPIGKVIRFADKTEYKVSGILQDIPQNSHFTIHFMISFNSRERMTGRNYNTWNYLQYTYFLLREDTNIRELEEKLNQLPDKYYYSSLEMKERRQLKYHLQPLSRIHLHSHRNFEIDENGDIKMIYILLSIAFLILVIACINYMNLTTARSVRRAREVGIRKMAGATRTQLAKQFICESMIFTILSFVISLALVYLLLPAFCLFVGRNLTFTLSGDIHLAGMLFALILFVGLLGGTYPAFVLSSFRPISVLRGSSGSRLQGSAIRQMLVVIQFTVSIILLTGTLIIRKQLEFVKNKDMGYRSDHIIAIVIRDESLYEKAEVLKIELLKNPDILSASFSSNLPNKMDYSIGLHFPGMDSDVRETINFSIVDYDFINLYEIKMVEGRNFSREFPSDNEGAFFSQEGL